MIVSSLDGMVNLAFPAIIQEFDVSGPSIRWVPISFLLTFGASLLVCGKLGDLYGYRRIFTWGLGVAAVALLSCSIAPWFGWYWLLGSRVLQGVGAALILSCSVALVTSLFSEKDQQTAIDLRVSMFALFSAIGPVLGGLLVEWAHWAIIFWSRALVLASLWLLVQLHPRLWPIPGHRTPWVPLMSGALCN